MHSAFSPIDDDVPGYTPLELSIVAGGTARLTVAELAESRKELMKYLPKSLSPQLLRHSDEQTLASLVAISEAIQNANMAKSDFNEWAIVSASRNLGRSAFAAVIDKYRDEGPWGVSVHVIPHCTAHSVAGTISLVLKSHGPCIGVGVGDDLEVDALLSTACILQRPDWFGAWVVFSAWSPELVIDTTGRPTSDSMCLAAAIAVTREWSACSIGRISFGRPHSPTADNRADARHEALSAGFMEFLAGADGVKRMWTSPPSHAIRIHVELDSSRRCEFDYHSPTNNTTNSETLRILMDSNESFAIAPYRTE
jgi:hypothetical protein